MKKPWWRRWWAKTIVIIFLLFIVLILAAPTLLKPIVRAKIQAALKDQLNAQLEIGGLSYLPPYSVGVSDVRLITNDTDGKPLDLISAKHIALSLGKLPLGNGPIVVNDLQIDSPAVYVVQTNDGMLGLVNHPSTTQPATTEPSPLPKISQLVQLQHLAITGATIIYIDHTTKQTAPMVWRDLNVNVKPTDTTTYTYDITGGDSLAVNGSVNVDDLRLHVEKCGLKLKIDPAAQESSIPAMLQQLLADYHFSGNVELTAGGDVPLTDPNNSTVIATLDLSNAAANVQGTPATLAAKITCSSETKPQPILRASLDQLDIRSGDAFVRAGGGKFVLNQSSQAVGVTDLKLTMSAGKDHAHWPAAVVQMLDQIKPEGEISCTINGSGPIDVNLKSLNDVNADIHVGLDKLEMHPPQLPQPLHDFADVDLHLGNGVATVNTIRAGYGDDVFFLAKTSLPLKDLPSKIAVEKISGAVTFAKNPPLYPPIVVPYLALAQPRGPFFFEGNASADLSGNSPQLDYKIRVTTDRGEISAMQGRIPVYNVNADLTITPKNIEISRFDADVLSGKISTQGRVSDIDDPAKINYAAQVRVRQIDLNSLAQAATSPGDKPITVTGDLSSDLTVSGVGTSMPDLTKALKAEGAIQVAHAQLFRVPVLSQVADKVKLSNLATVGEAGCTFKLEDGVIHLPNVAVGTPLIGVKADGTISLDQRVDLNVIATPFNDWDKQIRQTNNPVANVAATIAGTVQKGLNSVTENYLYKLKVTGPINDPKIQVNAAPALH